MSLRDDDFEFGGWLVDVDQDFCLVHGYEHMKNDRGPIAYCAECDREREVERERRKSGAFIT